MRHKARRAGDKIRGRPRAGRMRQGPEGLWRGRAEGMKLHDALRKAVREYGVRILEEKRLLFMLSDFGAFGEYPAAKEVLGDIVTGGAGKELVRLFLEEDSDWCLSYAQNLRKSLSDKKRFRKDLASYAVDSVLFGLGLVNAVAEPSDHGFDPVEYGSGAGRGGARALDESGVSDRKGGEAGRSSGVSGEGAAGNLWREPSEGTNGVQNRNTEAAGSGWAALRNAGSLDSSDGLKWLAAAMLLAVGFGFGWDMGGSHARSEALQAETGRGEVQSGADARNVREPPGQYEYEQGEKHYYGRGVSRNYAKALEWYRKAAEKWHPGAEYSMGWMYEYGQVVSRDYQTALSWYRKAAAQGNKDAQRGIERVEKLISGGGY